MIFRPETKLLRPPENSPGAGVGLPRQERSRRGAVDLPRPGSASPEMWCGRRRVPGLKIQLVGLLSGYLRCRLARSGEAGRCLIRCAPCSRAAGKIGLHCLSKERFNPLNQAILIRKSNIMTRPWAPVHGQAATACQIKLLALQIQERPQVRIASQDQYSA